MSEYMNIVIMVVILVLAGLLVAVGVHIINILKELRKTVVKTNTLLDTSDRILNNAEEVSEVAAEQATNISRAVNGIKGALNIFNYLKEKNG